MMRDALEMYNISYFEIVPTYLYEDDCDDYLSEDPNAQDENGNTLIHKFILNRESDEPDELEIIQSVISKGADLEIQNCSGKTAFLLAVVIRDKIMIEKLIENGANVFTQDNMGNNALHYIALPELNYLFESFYEVGFHEIKDEYKLNFVDTFSILERLLKEGVEVNLMNSYRETPLMWAARGYYLKIVKILLEYGANIHLQNDKLETCLHLACTPNTVNEMHWQESNSGILSELIRNEACVNCFDENNRTALCCIFWSRHANKNYFAKEFIKHASLVNWRRKMDFNITVELLLGALSSEALMASYVETGYNEIARMRNFQLSEASDLCQFARRGVSKVEESTASEVSDKVLYILLQETFPVYHDYILFSFQISYLRRKFRELHIFTQKEGRNIFLIPDVNFKIASFLEINDLFNVFKASTLRRS